METKNNENGNFGVTIFLFLLAGVLLVFSVKQQINTEKTTKELSDKISQKVTDEVKKELPNIINESEQKNSEYPDFFSLKDLKKLEIIKNFTSWTPDAHVDDTKVIKKIILEKGNLAKGYIYLKTSINDKTFSIWESIYIKMNNVGGHLFRPDSLPIPKSNKTELLYALDNISYLPTVPYSENKTPQKANWFNFFIDGKKIEVISFISSLRPALIEEITLYYDCTVESDCSLVVQ